MVSIGWNLFILVCPHYKMFYVEFYYSLTTDELLNYFTFQKTKNYTNTDIFQRDHSTSNN